MIGVEPATMPREQARELYREYRHHMKSKQCNPDDRALAASFKAMASGHAIVDLHATFAKCPLNETGQPRLAIARSNWKHVRFSRWGYAFNQWDGKQTLRAGEIRVPKLGVEYIEIATHSMVAPVPIPPLAIRPSPWMLTQCLTLWEVEKWEQPPSDPLLLRRIGNSHSLYVVIAQWDLTPLERMVMRGRL